MRQVPIRVTYIISNIDKALEFEWVAQYIDREQFTLSFIMLNPKPDSTLSQFAQEQGWEVAEVPYSGKKDMPKAFLLVLKRLRQWKPQVINCHLPEATLIGLTAGKVLGVSKRIYTRHHSTFNHEYHPHAVKYDLWANKMATHIIAITEMVREVLMEKEHVPKSKITVINHCIDLEKFEGVSLERVESLRVKYQIPRQKPIVGVIARYTEWKGVQYTIPAFRRLLEEYPDAHLVLANARQGEYIEELDKLLQKLPKESYTEIVFENDLYALYQLFDLFVHVPIDPYCEAFGQIYIEALAAKVPSIFTLSGIAREFVEDGTHALVVPYKNTSGILEAMKRLIEDKALVLKLKAGGASYVNQHFSISTKVQHLQDLYISHA